MYKLFVLLLSVLTVNTSPLRDCRSFNQWNQIPSFEITSDFTIESVLTLDFATPDEDDLYKESIKRKSIPLTGKFKGVEYNMIAEVFLYDDSTIETLVYYLAMFKGLINVKPLYFLQMFECLLDLSAGNRLIIFREEPEKNLAKNMDYVREKLKTDEKFDVIKVAEFFSFMAREVFFIHAKALPHLGVYPYSFYLEETEKFMIPRLGNYLPMSSFFTVEDKLLEGDLKYRDPAIFGIGENFAPSGINIKLHNRANDSYALCVTFYEILFGYDFLELPDEAKEELNTGGCGGGNYSNFIDSLMSTIGEKEEEFKGTYEDVADQNKVTNFFNIFRNLCLPIQSQRLKLYEALDAFDYFLESNVIQNDESGNPILSDFVIKNEQYAREYMVNNTGYDYFYVRHELEKKIKQDEELKKNDNFAQLKAFGTSVINFVTQTAPIEEQDFYGADGEENEAYVATDLTYKFDENLAIENYPYQALNMADYKDVLKTGDAELNAQIDEWFPDGRRRII